MQTIDIEKPLKIITCLRKVESISFDIFYFKHSEPSLILLFSAI